MPNHNSLAERHQASSESFEDERFFPNPSVHFLLSLTLNAFLTLRYVWIRSSRLRTFVVLLTLPGPSILYLLLILDFGFGLFFLQSDNFDYTLASQRWRARYWYPVNSLGYRDYRAFGSGVSWL